MCKLFYWLLGLSIVFCFANAFAAPISTTMQKWTYIRIADYDSLWGVWGPSLEETLQIHLPATTPQNVNYILLADAYGSTGSVYGYIIPSAKEQPAKRKIINIDEQTMGALDTYERFWDWVTTNFPAENYVLSYWGHGGGAGFSAGMLGYDDSSGRMGLSVNQWGAVVGSLSQKIQKKLSLVFTCTCLNGTIEGAYSIRNYADFLVTGETSVGCVSEPFDVLNYSTELNSEELAKLTLEEFQANAQNIQLDYDVVFAAIRLSAIDELSQEMKLLLSALRNLVKDNPDFKTQILQLASKVDNMGISATPDKFNTYLDLYDLAGHFANDLDSTDVKAIAARVQDLILNKVVVQLGHHNGNGHNAKSHGLSIIHPQLNYSQVDVNYYRTHEFSKATGWASYLQYISKNSNQAPKNLSALAPFAF